MRATRRFGLATKFNVLAIALILSTSLGIAVFVIHQEQIKEYERLVNHGRTIATMMAQHSEYGLYTEDAKFLQQIADSLTVDPDVVYVAILQRDQQRLLFKSMRPSISLPLVLYGAQTERASRLQVEVVLHRTDGQRYLDILAPVMSQTSQDVQEIFTHTAVSEGTSIIGYVQLGLSQERLQAHIAETLGSIVVFTALLGLLGIAATVLMTRRITSPLHALALMAHNISQGNWDQNITIKTSDEMADLAQAFTHMLARLQAYRTQVELDHRTLEERIEQRTVELRQATEKAQDMAQRAEEASQAKSQFLANMSHELRTPMNGVLGMTELLLRSQLTDKQRHFAETVRRSGETLLEIINDILDFSKIEAGKLVLENVDFDVRETVEDLVQLFAERYRRKGLELLCALHEAVPPIVQGDPARLRQILTNLLGNALKFTAHGEVAVRVTPVETTAERSVLRFAVQDTGVGIAPDMQEHIFQSFAQADQSTTRRYGGTGLGLAIAKRLATLMGGTIGVDSVPEQGSTFWFTAHFAAPPAPMPDAPKPCHHLHDLRLLIVDDNATHRQMLHDQVVPWGIRDSSAANGPQALEMLRTEAAQSHPYDVVILDMHMPGLGGIALARAMQSEPTATRVPLVLLTSIGIHDQAESVQETGVAHVLMKPVRQSQLYDCLTSLRACVASASTSGTTSPPDVETAQAVLQGHVLLVEDNLINQHVALDMLEGFGCQVSVVGNGQEAITALEHTSYDLVLMDCHMPVMDGFIATRIIRERQARTMASHLPIIAMTANAFAKDREQCLTAGMDDYLSKPFTLEQLYAMVAQWLQQAPTPKEVF